MRYKFRGKRKDTGEWVYGYLIDEDVICQGITFDDYGDIIAYKPVQVFPETVGQWTGFLDEKGEEVYEGDILLTQIAGETYKVEVFWNEELGCWDMRDDEDLSYFDIYRGLSPFQTHDYEIIGNIHDNPELLEGGEDEQTQ